MKLKVIAEEHMRILTPYEKNQIRKYGGATDQLNLEQQLAKTEMPVEYFTGCVEFCGLNFLVDENVLIPRVETEELVAMVVNRARDIFENKKKLISERNDVDYSKNINSEARINKYNQIKLNIIDVGTGSGAIAISVAKKLKDLRVPFTMTGLDISEKALGIARKNLERIDVNLAVEFIQAYLLYQYIEDKQVSEQTNLGDMPINKTQKYENISIYNNNHKIDILIANLPYIPSDRIRNLDSSVKDFEPHLALDGGKDGLYLVRKLLKQAETKLSKNGKVFLELDVTHDKNKIKEFENNWKIKLVESEFGGVWFWVANPLLQ